MNARHPAFVRQLARPLPADHPSADWRRGEALRVVLALALNERQLEACVPPPIWAELKSHELWPSQQLSSLAQWALVSPALWACLANELDARLGPCVSRLDEQIPAEIVVAFQLARPTGTTRELVAFVWCLVKRRQPALDALAARLARELESWVLQRCQLGEFTPE